MSDVLSVQSLTKQFPSKRALTGVTLTVGRGQVFGLLGPNGSGKTTTLGIVLGAVRQSSGSYTWFGQGVSGRERRRVGSLLEQPSFYPWLSGASNLAVIGAIRRCQKSAMDEALKTVGLWDVRGRPFQTYSLGMKQRLGIAAALLGKPEVLVLDEPTNGVDAQGIYEIRSIIAAYAQSGGTVVLASHMLDEVEKVCSHVAILSDGQVIKSGTIGSVLATRGWLEIGASDLDQLGRALGELEPKATLEQRDGFFELRDSVTSPAELNALLAKRGLYLSHLVQKQPSLESQYLNLVGTGAPS